MLLKKIRFLYELVTIKKSNFKTLQKHINFCVIKCLNGHSAKLVKIRSSITSTHVYSLTFVINFVTLTEINEKTFFTFHILIRTWYDFDTTAVTIMRRIIIT